MIFYIAGPMTGLPGYNREAFMDAARLLRTCGHTVLNPATLPVLPVEVLRHFAAAAGIHLYTRDAVDQIHVGNDVLFIHAVRGGKKSFILPAGTRLKGIIGPMKGRELASGEEWETEAAETNGFLLIR